MTMRDAWQVASEGGHQLPQMLQCPCLTCGGLVTFAVRADGAVDRTCDRCTDPVTAYDGEDVPA